MSVRLRQSGLTLIVLLLCCAPGHPATAKAPKGPTPDITDGFRLGKFATTAKMLAADLYYIQSLSTEFAIGKEDVIGSDPNNTDFALAGSALTYSIWRVKLAVLPVCEDGLKSEALDKQAVQPYSQELRDLLTGLKADCQDFTGAVSKGDQLALSKLVDHIHAGDYVGRLLALADRATAAAGEAPAS